MTLFGKITKANRWWGSALRGKHSATATTRADQRKPEQHINLSYHGDVSMQLCGRKLSLLGRYSRGIKSNPSKFTDVDKAMKRLFDEKPFNRKAIKHFIETRLEVMNVSNMINFLHIASRKRYLVEDATLGRLHNRIQSFEFQLKDHHIGKAFYAFRTLNSSPNALQLVKIYSRFLERSHDLSQLTLANAFYTLQLLQSESQLHRELFDNLSRIIRNNPPLTLSNSNVCAILSGIRNVRDCDQQSLLEALLPLFEKATGELNSSEAINITCSD